MPPWIPLNESDAFVVHLYCFYMPTFLIVYLKLYIIQLVMFISMFRGYSIPFGYQKDLLFFFLITLR